MKIKPELLLIKKTNTIYRKILITGSDESLKSHLTEYFIKQFKEKKYFIDRLGADNKNIVGDLFSDKKVLFLLKDPSIKEDLSRLINNNENSILISSSNINKVRELRSIFLKSKTDLLIECYSLNRSGKEFVCKSFVETNNMQISTEVFWYIVENFENEYVLLVKQLETLFLFNKKISYIYEVEKAVFVEYKIEVNKIFFHILRDNKALIKVFKNNIFSQSDFYFFLNSLKLYIGLISNSSDKEDALNKFPKYLFNEKDIFIKLFNLLDKKKIIRIYNNIFKVEKLTRKSPSLYFIIGVRFLVNTRKIITS